MDCRYAMVAGGILLAGGTYGYMMSHPASVVEFESKIDPKTRDDQYKTPSDDAAAARVKREQSGAPLSKNI